MAEIEWRLDEHAMKELFDTPEGAVPKALFKVGQRVANRAKQLCPVDTGRLRDSITADLQHEPEGYVVAVGSNVEYAPFVEFGTRYWVGHPFLLPAAKEITK